MTTTGNVSTGKSLLPLPDTGFSMTTTGIVGVAVGVVGCVTTGVGVTAGVVGCVTTGFGVTAGVVGCVTTGFGVTVGVVGCVTTGFGVTVGVVGCVTTGFGVTVGVVGCVTAGLVTTLPPILPPDEPPEPDDPPPITTGVVTLVEPLTCKPPPTVLRPAGETGLVVLVSVTPVLPATPLNPPKPDALLAVPTIFAWRPPVRRPVLFCFITNKLSPIFLSIISIYDYCRHPHPAPSRHPQKPYESTFSVLPPPGL